MKPSEKQVDLMQMLATAEESVGRLYEAYASRFPHHEEFWSGLAMEEADHSNAIHDLISKVREGSASFFEDRLMIGDVQRFQDNLKEQQERAEREEISFTDALLVALDIEKSLIERRFYRPFNGISEGTRHILEYLESASGNHVKILQKELERHNKQE